MTWQMGALDRADEPRIHAMIVGRERDEQPTAFVIG
jgi:hypothetical protein